jgi:hypothetical protein
MINSRGMFYDKLELNGMIIAVQLIFCHIIKQRRNLP